MSWLVAILFSQIIQAQSYEAPVVIQEADVPTVVGKSTDVLVMINGYFSNTCYKYRSTDIRHPDAFTHEIRAFAIVEGEVCLMKIVNFQRDIELGQLPAGEHTVLIFSGDGKVFEHKMLVQ